MTREQTTQQDVQQDGAAAATDAADQSHGLPPALHAQILQMTPADARALAEMLRLHADLADSILSVAASHMGNAAVQRAIAIANHAKPPGREAPLSHAQMHEFLDDPAQGPQATAPLSAGPQQPGPLSHAEMHEVMDDPAAGPAKNAPLSHAEMRAVLEDPSSGPQKAALPIESAAPKASHAAAEPAWVAGARAYNAAHADLVDEFNELTNNVVQLDGETRVDPQSVARWQSHHGLAPDGKIGPHTVAKARTLKARAPEVACAAPGADARPPV